MEQFGPDALGETLEPGRVTACYLGLLLPPGPAGEPEVGTVLVVTPAALLHPGVPQPAGSLVYALLTGHLEREPGELVFVADLTVELRAWPTDTWTKLGVDPEQVAQAVIGCWRPARSPGCRSTTSASRRPARGGSEASGLYAPLGGSGATAPCSALRAIDPSARPRLLADLRSAPPSAAISSLTWLPPRVVRHAHRHGRACPDALGSRQAQSIIADLDRLAWRAP